MYGRQPGCISHGIRFITDLYTTFSIVEGESQAREGGIYAALLVLGWSQGSGHIYGHLRWIRPEEVSRSKEECLLQSIQGF